MIFVSLAGYQVTEAQGGWGVHLYFPGLPKRRGKARRGAGSDARCAAEEDGTQCCPQAGTDFKGKPGRLPGRAPSELVSTCCRNRPARTGASSNTDLPPCVSAAQKRGSRADTRGEQAALRSEARHRLLHSRSGPLPPSSEPAMAWPVFLTSHRLTGTFCLHLAHFQGCS